MLGYIFFLFPRCTVPMLLVCHGRGYKLKKFLSTDNCLSQINEVAPVTFTANTVSLIYQNIWKDVLSFGQAVSAPVTVTKHRQQYLALISTTRTSTQTLHHFNDLPFSSQPPGRPHFQSTVDQEDGIQTSATGLGCIQGHAGFVPSKSLERVGNISASALNIPSRNSKQKLASNPDGTCIGRWFHCCLMKSDPKQIRWITFITCTGQVLSTSMLFP